MAETIKNLLNLQKEDLETFDYFKDVELTEDDVNQALFEARQKKYFNNKIIDYKKKLSEELEYPTFAPKDLYQKIHDNGFIVDESNKQIIWNLCRYFSGDPNGPYNIRKGIMLYGPVGCYKTSLMRFFANNQNSSFVIHSVNDVSAQFTKEGHDAILKYKGLIQSTDTFRTFGQKDIGICFDDFGTEIDKKHYGNESNVMAEIILSRFMSHQNLIGKTHFTTNIKADVISERYGERVKSRLREMVNIVAFPDESLDRRK